MKQPSPQSFAHARHTGHWLPRQHTSYPTLVMILLVVGVLLVGWTSYASGDPFVFPGPVTNSYDVNARVPGPAPTIAPTIDSPLDAAVFEDVPIDVSGTCPVNTYVTLYRNGAFSGVALCQADSTWRLQTGLFVGANQLQARVFSPTDVPGPLSNIVNVTYQPPVPPTPPTPPSSGGTPGSPTNTGQPSSGGTRPSGGGQTLPAPLIFKTTFNYRGVYTGKPSNWELSLEGGTAPYAISVDWGDGTSDLISRSTAGGFSLQHIYKKAGGYKGNYVVKFSAIDADGTKAFLQLLAIVNDPPGGAGATTGKKPPDVFKSDLGILGNVMNYLWPSYLIVLLMLTSFWLGERRELKVIQSHFKKPRRTRHA